MCLYVPVPHHRARVVDWRKWGAEWKRLLKPLMISLSLYSRLWYRTLHHTPARLLTITLVIRRESPMFGVMLNHPSCHTKQNLRTWLSINMTRMRNPNYSLHSRKYWRAHPPARTLFSNTEAKAKRGLEPKWGSSHSMCILTARMFSEECYGKGLYYSSFKCISIFLPPKYPTEM